MNFDAIRLGLGILWLGVAVVAVARPAGLGERLDGENGVLIALAALALAVWNLGRWYSLRSTAHGPLSGAKDQPLRRRGESRRDEYHPEFDFTKRDGG